MAGTQQAPSHRPIMNMLPDVPRQSLDYNFSALTPAEDGTQGQHSENVANAFPQHNTATPAAGPELTPAPLSRQAPHSSRLSSHQSDHGPSSPSAAAVVPQFAELSLRAAGEEEQPHQVSSAHRTAAAASVLTQGAALVYTLHSTSMCSAPPLQPHHSLPHASSHPMLNPSSSDQRFPAPPLHQQRPLAHRGAQHSQAPQHPGIMPGMLQYGDALSIGMAVPDMSILSSMPLQTPMHTQMSSGMPQVPFPQYSPSTLQQIVSSMQSNAQMPYGMPIPSPAVQMPPQQHSGLPMPALNSNPVSPMPALSQPSTPTWCVVTGLPRACAPPPVPPEGVLNISHLLPWPQAVREMLQRGWLGLTLDPTVRESRGRMDQPALMLMVTQPAESGTLLRGLLFTMSCL